MTYLGEVSVQFLQQGGVLADQRLVPRLDLLLILLHLFSSHEQ